MIRIFLYVLLAYIAWKIIKIIFVQKKNTRREYHEPDSSKTSTIEFPNIEEAKFEDLPPQPPSDDTPSQEK